MSCVACAAPGEGVLCRRCGETLRRAPERWLDGVLVRSAFVHEGAARALVHRIKYQAVPLPAVGRTLAPLVPPGATALVPIPRVTARRWRYGVDPALEIARSLAAISRLPVLTALQAPIWVHRRAGRSGEIHGRARFRRRAPVPPGAVLVDDVVTTGATLLAAASVTGCTAAVTFTSALRP
ncbi:MAG TPA: hypothetical protein VJA44_00210 [Acidimicrobiia bacterium]|nr:hypothetical protein [Acidimicrobiia bacterium]